MSSPRLDSADSPSLRRLAKALRLAQGFALLFARCNVPVFRAALVERLRRTIDRPIVEADLQAESDPWRAVAASAQKAPPGAVIFVYGLDSLLPSADQRRARATLGSLNWRRSAYARVQRPLVFWVPEYVLPLVAEGAPDFFDWNSGVFEFDVPQPVRETVLADALGEDDLALAALGARQKRERLELLEGLWEEYAGPQDVSGPAQLRVATHLGTLHRLLGDYEAAETWLRRALQVAGAMGDRTGEAATWHGLAAIDLRQGQYDAARQGFQRSLAMRQEIGDRAGEAATWHNLATIDVHLGGYDAAREGFQRSLAIEQEIGDRAGEAATRHNLATIDMRQGQYDAAREGFQRALAIKQAIGDRAGEAATWHQLATIDVDQGQYDAARQGFQRSLAIKQEIGDRAGEAATWAQLGILAANMGRREAGLRLVALSAGLLQPLGHADLEQVTPWLNRLASELQYTQEQLDAMFREVAEAYGRDRGQGLLRAAFPQEGMAPDP